MNTKSTPIRLTSKAALLFSQFSELGRAAVTPPKTEPKPKSDPRLLTARLEAMDEGVCPYCKNQMRRSFSQGLEVWLCEEDRHVAPIRDEVTNVPSVSPQPAGD